LKKLGKKLGGSSGIPGDLDDLSDMSDLSDQSMESSDEDSRSRKPEASKRYRTVLSDK
jgi:hypothetical protein